MSKRVNYLRESDVFPQDIVQNLFRLHTNYLVVTSHFHHKIIPSYSILVGVWYCVLCGVTVGIYLASLPTP